MDNREKERLETLEYVIDDNGKKHHVYPMKIKERNKVSDLFSKINDEYPVLNFPMPLLNKDGKPELDEDGKQIENIEPYEAMMELLKMALRDDNVEDWIDVGQISMILAAYRGLSGLKKKLATQEKNLQIGIKYLQDL